MSKFSDTQKFQVISFDSSCLQNFSDLELLARIFEPSKCAHSILMCGSFASLHQDLDDLSNIVMSMDKKEVIEVLEKIFQGHNDILSSFSDEIDTNYYAHLVDALEKSKKNISSLLNGIKLIKEISARTKLLLDIYASRMCAVLIQAILCKTHNIQQVFIKYDEINSLDHSTYKSHGIIPLPSAHNDRDILLAQITTKFPVLHLDIWTSFGGIMSANPKIVAEPYPVKHIDYETAQEIGYLGGKVLHPTAIGIIAKHNIPIHLYSSKKPEDIATIIDTSGSKKSDLLFFITERDKISTVTIRSSEMFDATGYLEKIFKVFSMCNVAAETLSSSEISISLTFPSKYYSSMFEYELKKLGEIHMNHNQTIISLVGVTSLKSSKLLSKVLLALDESSINIMSLGETGSNLNIVVDSHKKQDCIINLHKVCRTK